MRVENLFQFIVPLTFLAIWAITSLFNRDAQPPPPRVGNRPPRPDLRRPPGGGQPPAEARGPRTPDFRTYDPDEIRYVRESPTGGPVTQSEPPRMPRGTRGAPSKSKPRRPASDPRPAARPATLSGIEGSTPVRNVSLKPLDLGHPIDLKLSPAASNATTPSASGSAARITDVRQATPEFLGTALTPDVLRRNFVMAEILFRPPVALRRGPLPMRGEAPPAAD